VRSGKLSPEEAGVHPQRSVITRVLGADPEVDVDTFEVEAQPGDVFMLCSDGLTSMVDDDAILSLLGRGRSLEQGAHELVDAANRGGGEDNITVILFELDEGEPDDTATFPAMTEEEPEPDDERTLTELDAVPAVDDTMLVSRADLEAITEAEKRSRVPRTAIAVVSGTILVVLAAFVVWTLSRSYFVGTQPDGHIAVYQGFPWNVVGSIRLYRVRYESPVLAGQLSQSERRTLFDHDLRTYGRALDAVKRYENEVVP
jgi:protein phosphatase